MRTENDLRDAIDALADEGAYITAFHEFATRREVRPRRGRPVRVLAPIVAALAVAAVTVAGVAVFHDRRHGVGTPSGGTRPVPLAWSFSTGHVAGYRIVRDGISRYSFPAADVGESAGVTTTGSGRASGTIEFDTVPGRIVESSTSRKIHGVRYFFRPGRHVARQGGLTAGQYARPWVAVGQDAHGPQLSWHYPDGSQFIVSGSFGFRPSTYDYDNAAARRILTRIARAVRPGRTAAVTMPFRLPSPGDGLVPVSLDTEPASQQDADPLVGRQPLSACLDYAKPRHPAPLTPIEALLRVCRVEPLGGRQHTLDAIAFDADVIGRYVVRRLPDGTLLAVGLPTGRTGRFTRAQLKALAEKADVAPSLAKPGTWLEVG